MKKNITLIISLATLLISCTSAKDDNNNVPELDMIGSKEISFDNLVNGVECFQLIEAGTNSFLKIMEYDDFFYLYLFIDGVSVYKKSGEFVRTITSHARGAVAMDMFVNEKEKQLWILEQFEYISKYTLDGQFIAQQKLPFKTVKLAPAGTNHFLFFDGIVDKTTSSFLRIVSDGDFSTNAEFVPKYNINNSIPVSTFTYSSDEIFIYLPYNDTIYVCDNSNLKVIPKWRLNFSGDFLTHHDIPEGGYSNKKYAEIMHENRKYRGLRGVHYVNKFIFMQLDGKDNSFRAIDITNNHTYRFDTLIDNITTSPQGKTTDGLLIVMTYEDFIHHYSNPDNRSGYESINEMLNKENERDGGLIVLKIKLKEDLP